MPLCKRHFINGIPIGYPCVVDEYIYPAKRIHSAFEYGRNIIFFANIPLYGQHSASFCQICAKRLAHFVVGMGIDHHRGSLLHQASANACSNALCAASYNRYLAR